VVLAYAALACHMECAPGAADSAEACVAGILAASVAAYRVRALAAVGAWLRVDPPEGSTVSLAGVLLGGAAVVESVWIQLWVAPAGMYRSLRSSDATADHAGVMAIVLGILLPVGVAWVLRGPTKGQDDAPPSPPTPAAAAAAP
jgi:hypothetical protein